MLLVSVGDRKARIELGAGWGGTKDETARMVMDDIIVPNFKKGDHSAGILQGVRALETVARGPTVRKPVSRVPLLLLLGFVGLGVFLGISLIRSGRQGWGWAVLAAVFALVAGLLWFTSKTGGGDRDNYEGGSGGGGGATGSW